MKELVDKIKSIEKYLGIYSKQVMPCEKTIKDSLRRRIIAKKFIPQQKRIEMDDIIWVRAKNGLSPGEEKAILGKITKKEIKKGDPILEELIG
jgi:sialic acid synthase SpsE